ncbi:hypothetical protein AYI70_g2021 [Smittium culicis]|uniref:Plasmodium RESA N-terminal domain-containing protein n=1 Tax=Smittium culicis TaxID=133412 RepID=A0A1R1YA73_9FUNG|nr:hypothetical protein AYI70_g2021 [Smittium culicis]
MDMNNHNSYLLKNNQSKLNEKNKLIYYDNYNKNDRKYEDIKDYEDKNEFIEIEAILDKENKVEIDLEEYELKSVKNDDSESDGGNSIEGVYEEEKSISRYSIVEEQDDDYEQEEFEKEGIKGENSIVEDYDDDYDDDDYEQEEKVEAIEKEAKARNGVVEEIEIQEALFFKNITFNMIKINEKARRFQTNIINFYLGVQNLPEINTKDRLDSFSVLCEEYFTENIDDFKELDKYVRYIDNSISYAYGFSKDFNYYLNEVEQFIQLLYSSISSYYDILKVCQARKKAM